MKSKRAGRAVLAAAIFAFLLGGCGGGGVSFVLTFNVLGINPDTSVDLNGGDLVEITGANFVTANVANVTFGGTPGLNFQRIDENTIRVTAPPAPGGVAGAVDIEVVSVLAGSKFIINGFTYTGNPAGPPVPATIIPTTFSATGAEEFTIQGSNLGPSNGTVQVTFANVGTVTGRVSATGQIVTGRAPVRPVTPPTVPLTVTVTNGAQSGDVPAQILFNWVAPVSFNVRGQIGTPGQASQPVRLADGFAAMCCGGPDLTWGTADDEVVIIKGPPNAPVGPIHVTVGYLDQRNSIPAVLDGNTLAVYSPGQSPAQSHIVLITSAQTTPVYTPLGAPQMNPAPVAAIASNRIAFTWAGTNGTLGDPDDELRVYELAGATVSTIHSRVVGPVDVVGFGLGNFSIPFSSGGDTVFVVTAGIGGAGGPSTALGAYTLSTATGYTSGPAAYIASRPIAISPTVAVALAGQGGASPSGNDALAVFSISGGAVVRSLFALDPALGANGFPFTPRPVVRLGGGNVALAATGPGSTQVRIYTNPAAGTFVSATWPGTPLLAPLGSGDLLVFGPGVDLITGTAPDAVTFLDSAGTTAQNFVSVPLWLQNYGPMTDNDRAFATAGGASGFGFGTEVIIVQQSRSLGAVSDSAVLPLGSVSSPVLGGFPFVPVGPGWGLIQSPGGNKTFLDADDQVILARY